MKLPVMYHGERAFPISGKIVQVFKDRKGEEHCWSGVKGVYFGYVYEAEKKGTEITIRMRPAEIEVKGWEATQADHDQMEANKILVKEIRARRRKDLEYKKPHADIVKAIELLKPFYRGLSKWDAQRFTDWLSNECSKPKRK